MEYWTLSEENLDIVLPKIAADGGYFGSNGRAEPLLRYFQRELEQAVFRNCALVVYKKDGVWKYIFISLEYNIDWVMTQAEDRL